MPSAPSIDSPQFRGIDPAGLVALDQWCRGRSDALVDAGRECVALGVHVDEGAVVFIGRSLVTLGHRVRAAASELAGRDAAIEAAQQIPAGYMRSRIVELSAALRRRLEWLGSDGGKVASWRQAPVEAAVRLRRLGAQDRSRALADLGADEVFTWVEQLILGDTDQGAEPAVGEIARGLRGDDLVGLARRLSAAGHDDRVVAGLVDHVAGSGSRRLEDVVAAALQTREEGHGTGTLVIGRLLMVGSPAVASIIARRATGAPGTLSDAMRRAAAADAAMERVDALATMTAALAAIGDTALRTRVALDLMESTGGRAGEPWRQQLDMIITQLLITDVPGSLNAIATELDPAAERLVPWFRRLFGSDDGASHLGDLLDEVGPWIEGRAAGGAGHDPIDRARVSGLLAGSLTVAARLEAAAAHRVVGELGVVAGRIELVLSALSAIPSGAGIVAPGSLDIGVAESSAGAGDRIDRALWRLVERIDERFAPTAGSFGLALGRALDSFDDAHDAVVRHWSG